MNSLANRLTAAVMAALLILTGTAQAAGQDRPNILWITNEDISADLGCYGVDYAETPTLDRFAEEGVLYTNAFATSGVCAPARSCLIMGMYPSALGSHHMRCRGELPDSFKMFPGYLREAGYYCTNNRKQDYNLPTVPGTWDESSGKAHYKNREDGQPFFAVFNFTMTHESRMFGRHETEHDPAQASVPPYHPDHPLVREDWARYHDQISTFDGKVEEMLDELEERGLADETIVFYYSDHGAGLPRGKRWIWDSGMHVPLIVRFPEKYQHLAPAAPGSKTDRLVSFVDFGPTVLSLCGVDVPEHMHGKPFLGDQEAEPREYVYGIRGRIDERYDMQRAVRDERFKYIRNYMPHKTYALHVSYMYRMETMQTWQRLHDEGELDPVRDFFFAERRPVEELYDTRNDPHEIHNLADDPEYQDVLKRLRKQQFAWMRRIRDVGLLPEPEIKERPHRAGYANAYEWARPAEQAYPFDRIHDAAVTAQRGKPALDAMRDNLEKEDRAVRFWAALGLNGLGEDAASAKHALVKALDDEDPSVATEAAQALVKLGAGEKALPVLAGFLEHENGYVRLRAANALDHLDEKARPALDAMRAANKAKGQVRYVRRVLEHAVAELEK